MMNLWQISCPNEEIVMLSQDLCSQHIVLRKNCDIMTATEFRGAIKEYEPSETEK